MAPYLCGLNLDDPDVVVPTPLNMAPYLCGINLDNPDVVVPTTEHGSLPLWSQS
jgi:hypothetical protein